MSIMTRALGKSFIRLAACWVLFALCFSLPKLRLHPYGPLPVQVVPAFLSLHPPQSHASSQSFFSPFRRVLSLQSLRLRLLFVSYIPLLCSVRSKQGIAPLQAYLFLHQVLQASLRLFSPTEYFRELYNYIIIPPTCQRFYLDIYPSHSRVSSSSSQDCEACHPTLALASPELLHIAVVLITCRYPTAPFVIH